MRLAVLLAFLVAACGGGGGGGGSAAVCNVPTSLNVTCATPGWYYCGKNAQSQDACCNPATPFTCPNGTQCYVTADAAKGACGTACMACAEPAPACTPAGSGTCSTAGNLFCGGTTCCGGSYPFYCAATNQCYATEGAAKAACGIACVACSQTTAACTPAGSGTCSAAGNVFCGGTTCCGASHPFYCATANLCYATEEAAKAACGAACMACSQTTAACTPAGSGTCSTAGNVFCGGTTCCGAAYPFFCAATNLCYGTEDAAKAACGAACMACSSSGTGSLRVDVTGLPTDASASILVTGPGGYSQRVTGTQTLTGLVAGSYLIQVKPVRQAGTMADVLYDGPDRTATVTPGGTANAAAAYARRPGTGQLWVPRLHNGRSTILGIPSHVEITPSQDWSLNGIAFDAAGNMWVSAFSFGTGTSDTTALLQFPVSLLDASGTVAPSIVIGPSNHSLDWPTSLAFDPEGNLWITNWGREGRASTIVKYAASQLATSGNLAPAATILSDGNSLLSPAALAFDANGALWVANFGGSNTSTELVKYTPAQLSATGSPTPAVAIITRNQEGLDGILPTAMAFDVAGNLWMGGYFDTPIVMLSPAQLSASGKPLPAIFYKALQSPVGKTMGMAFDAGGNLWVAQPDVLYGLAKDKIYAGGSLDGSVMIEGIDLASPSAVYAFDPPPTDLPLCQPR